MDVFYVYIDFMYVHEQVHKGNVTDQLTLPFSFLTGRQLSCWSWWTPEGEMLQSKPTGQAVEQIQLRSGPSGHRSGADASMVLR
jgi:hypothetical protein